VTFEGECKTSTSDGGWANEITPDTHDGSVSIGTHYLRSEFKYEIEELSTPEPSRDSVLKVTNPMTGTVWIYYFNSSLSNNHWMRSDYGNRFKWEDLITFLNEEKYTYKVYKMTEVK